MKGKILFITNVDWFFISHRLNIGLKAISEGYEVHIATTFTNCESDLISQGFRTHKLDIDRCKTNIFNSLRTLVQIFFIIYEIKPDIIHSITIKPVLFGGIVSRFFRKTKFVASISGLGYVFISKSKLNKMIKFFVKILYVFSLSQKGVKVIFQNSNDERIITKCCNLKKKDKILIPGSGVDLRFFKPNKINNKSEIILFASRLLISKGILEFIKSAEELNYLGCKFVIAGKLDIDNPDCISKKELDFYLKKGIVDYLGEIKNIRDLLLKTKIVVLPSFYGEGLPKILIEAAACGVPVITTDHPGCRDAIIPDRTGIIVPIKNTRSIIKGIQRLLQSPVIYENMSKEARLLALKKYDVKNVVKKHLEIYDQLIN